MKKSHSKQGQRGGVVLVALLTLSFGAVSALVWVNLIATRAMHMDTAQDALQRRIVMGNSRLLAKHYLYDHVVAETFGNNLDDITFEVKDGDGVTWGHFFVGGMSDRLPGGGSPQYAATDTALAVVTKSGHQNRFSDAHNVDAYTFIPDVRLGDGTGLIEGVDGSDADPFEDRVRYFIKSRSPLAGGTGIYTALGEAGLATVGGGTQQIGSIARTYHAEPGSSTSYQYTANYADRAYRPSQASPTHSSPALSNFPDTVHTWGRPAGTTTVESDYNGRAITAADAEARIQRALQNRPGGSSIPFQYLHITAGVDDPPDLADVFGAGSEVLRWEVRDAFGVAVRSGILPYHYYNDGTLDGAKSEDPLHGVASGADLFPHYHRPEDSDPVNGVSQVFRSDDGITVTNTLRIDLTRSGLIPVVVESGVEEIEFVGDGQYNGGSVEETDPAMSATAVVVTQATDTVSRIRFYGTKCDRALYFSIGNNGAGSIDWLWHGTDPVAGAVSADPLATLDHPSFRIVAEIEGSALSFGFNGTNSDVIIRGGVRVSRPLTAGSATQEVLFIDEKTNPFAEAGASATTLGLIERYAARVAWIETTMTLGVENERP